MLRARCAESTIDFGRARAVEKHDIDRRQQRAGQGAHSFGLVSDSALGIETARAQRRRNVVRDMRAGDVDHATGYWIKRIRRRFDQNQR